MMMMDADNDNAANDLPNEPSALSFLIAGLLPLTAFEQQDLLNMDDAIMRLKAVMKIINRETILMQEIPSVLKAVMKIINRETILMQEIPSVPAPFLTRVTISPN
jgi:hypothetical protein